MCSTKLVHTFGQYLLYQLNEKCGIPAVEEGTVGEHGVEEAGGLWTGQRLGEASEGLHTLVHELAPSRVKTDDDCYGGAEGVGGLKQEAVKVLLQWEHRKSACSLGCGWCGEEWDQHCSEGEGDVGQREGLGDCGEAGEEGDWTWARTNVARRLISKLRSQWRRGALGFCQPSTQKQTMWSMEENGVQ